MTFSKKRDYTEFMVPTATRQPESSRALAVKDKLMRKGYQKLGDLTKIISTVTNKVTHLSDWWSELTLSVHNMVARKVTQDTHWMTGIRDN